MRSYEAALGDPHMSKRSRSVQREPNPVHSMRLMIAYYGSTAFGDLGEATKAYRRRLIEKLRPDFGRHPITLVDSQARRRSVAEGHQADHAQTVAEDAARSCSGMRSRCRCCPSIRRPASRSSKRKLKGHATWDEHWIEVFRAHHMLGTQSRLALELLLNTAQRRGDVVRMGPQHVRQTSDGPGDCGHTGKDQHQAGDSVASRSDRRHRGDTVWALELFGN